MKECKVIHITDGTPEELEIDSRFYAEEYRSSGRLISRYLNDGYEIAQIIPDTTDISQSLPYHKTGFTVFFVREKDLV